MPNPEPMPEKEKPAFYPVRDRVVQQLDAIPFPERKEVIEEITLDSVKEISGLIE